MNHIPAILLFGFIAGAVRYEMKGARGKSLMNTSQIEAGGHVVLVVGGTGSGPNIETIRIAHALNLNEPAAEAQ